MPSLSDAGRRLRDELEVEPTPVDSLRRRHIRTLRRRGILASLVVAAMVIGLVTAVQSRPASQHVVVPAAPRVSTNPASHTSHQPSAPGCTPADLSRPRPTAMPTPTAVTSAMPIGGGETVGPPAPGSSIGSAAVSAQQVWSHDYLDAIPDVKVLPQAGGGVNEMYLGSFHDAATGKDRLVWLLERTGVAMGPAGGGPVSNPGTAIPPATTAVQGVCRFYTLIVVVDATTGRPLQEGFDLESSPGTRSGSPAPTTAPTGTESPPAGQASPDCRQGQIQARLVGIQGAAGNWAAAFWVADSSPQPCLLGAPARIDLLNGSGKVELSATSSFSPIPLTANTSIPTGQVVKSGELAYLTLFWPTDPNAAASQGSSSGYCPAPDFVPSAARLTFGATATVTVTELRATSRAIAVCGQHISIADVGPLTPG